MNLDSDLLIAFHLATWGFREVFKLLHFVQFIVDFSITTTEQLVHIFFNAVKWPLHPIKEIKDVKEMVASCKQNPTKQFDVGELLRNCPIRTWLYAKALEFSAGANAVEFHSQQSEAAIRDFIGSIDLKHLFERVASVPLALFPLRTDEEDADSEAQDLPEPEGNWCHYHFWKVPLRASFFGHFKAAPTAPEPEVVSLYSTTSHKSKLAGNSDRIGEVAESETSMVTDEAASRPSTNGAVEGTSSVLEANGASVALDLKSIWNGRRRKRKSQ